MNIDDIAALLEGRPELQAFMLEVIDCTPEELQALTALLQNWNMDTVELIGLLPQIRDEKRIKALVCWAEQYKG